MNSKNRNISRKAEERFGRHIETLSKTFSPFELYKAYRMAQHVPDAGRSSAYHHFGQIQPPHRRRLLLRRGNPPSLGRVPPSSSHAWRGRKGCQATISDLAGNLFRHVPDVSASQRFQRIRVSSDDILYPPASDCRDFLSFTATFVRTAELRYTGVAGHIGCDLHALRADHALPAGILFLV